MKVLPCVFDCTTFTRRNTSSKCLPRWATAVLGFAQVEQVAVSVSHTRLAKNPPKDKETGDWGLGTGDSYQLSVISYQFSVIKYHAGTVHCGWYCWLSL